ncbi:phospholipase effector Tle1 domain-containing protein [Burkholderia multivorans]|uniref:phospholipase effector Tle1 domain-containing protein n=1 Tax=Burkholderia multivorans TaxID=87883 RepID=UPI00345E1D97
MVDPDFDDSVLHPVDRTPKTVRTKRANSELAYKHDDCIPCGGIVHMGFFFDGFARHRDMDDPDTSRYSNICRLWEAHRTNIDPRRKDAPYANQLWYRFYYSGLGTELNAEAASGAVESAALKAVKGTVGAVGDKLKALPGKIAGTERLKIDPANAAEEAIKKGLSEGSWKPVTNSFNDIVKTMEKAPDSAMRVLRLMRDDRWVSRGRAVVRSVLYDAKESPLKLPGSILRSVVVNYGIDTIPWFRDNRAISRVLGTGVEDRVSAALRQFERTVDDARAVRDKLQRIQISVFAADRGAVIARVFVNRLVEKYKLRHATDLEVHGIPIEIKFMGLFDAVSSLMEENKLLSMLPVLGLLKQNYGDLSLAVPEAVQRCVHFAAAHELRFYQRLDSLEKTRGEQYLYPGTSEDVTGGSPPGSLGARAELQRVPLREMLDAAYESGVAIDSMELLSRYKRDTFLKFSLARVISDGPESYNMGELMEAYRALVPRKPGLNFDEHMKVFLRWIAVRYQSPAFRNAEGFAGSHRRSRQGDAAVCPRRYTGLSGARCATRDGASSTLRVAVDRYGARSLYGYRAVPDRVRSRHA